jgi:hypothetical protein
MFSIKHDVKRLEDLIDYIGKGFQSLMVVNGAALVTCLASLKDYATSPAYKGVGVIILLFAVGLTGL